MSFNKASVNIVRFNVVDPLPASLDIEGSLRRFALVEIDDSPEMSAMGWTSAEDILDTKFSSPVMNGEYAHFALRFDERKIPGAVLKKHVSLAMTEEKAKTNVKVISRERKGEIKEQIALRLRSRYLPVPSSQDVLWNIPANEVWFTGTGTKQIELFMEYFTRTFGLHLLQKGAYDLALEKFPIKEKELATIEDTAFGQTDTDGLAAKTAEDILGRDFLTWLWYFSSNSMEFASELEKEAGEAFSAYIEKKLVMANSQGESLSLSSDVSDFSEIRGTVTQSNKKVEKACLTIEADEYTWRMSLNSSNLFPQALRCPKIDKEGFAEDKDAYFLEKVYLMEKAVKYLDSLFFVFLKYRLDKQSWNTVLKDIHDWSMSEGAA